VTETSRVAAWHAVVRVLPTTGVLEERFLRQGKYLGGTSTWLAVVGRRRQTAGLVWPRSMLSLLVLAREAAAADGRLARLTTPVVV